MALELEEVGEEKLVDGGVGNEGEYEEEKSREMDDDNEDEDDDDDQKTTPTIRKLKQYISHTDLVGSKHASSRRAITTTLLESKKDECCIFLLYCISVRCF